MHNIYSKHQYFKSALSSVHICLFSKKVKIISIDFYIQRTFCQILLDENVLASKFRFFLSNENIYKMMCGFIVFEASKRIP